MQQQSLFEWSNLYWRCELVHLWLCRWLHRNTLRDRFVLNNDVYCSPYADHLNDNFIFSSLCVNYLKQAGWTLKRAMRYHPVLNSFIWMQISTNAAAILVWMEQRVLTLWTRTLVAVALVTPEHTARQVHRQRQFFTHALALGWLRTYFSMGNFCYFIHKMLRYMASLIPILLWRRNVT